MPDIEDAGETLEQEHQIAAPQVDPKEIARVLADELVQRAQPQTKAQANKTQATIEKYLAQGVSKEGIQTLLDILNARDEDLRSQYQEQAAEQAANQFNQALFAQAETAIEDAGADQIKNFRYVKKGLVERMSEVMAQDPEFKDARELMDKGRVPGKKHFDKAAEKVINEFAGGEIQKKPPLEVRSSMKSKANDEFSEERLVGEPRKLYFALKSHLGEEAARRAIGQKMR